MRSSLNSLRVRLPLLFLAGILIAGLVTGLIAIQLFRDFARNQTLSELRRESSSIAQLYSSWVAADFAARRGESRRPPTFAGAALEKATGDRIYFDGPVSPFPGEDPGLPRIDLQQDRLDVGELAHVRLHAAEARGRLLRGREPGAGGEDDDRRDRGREAEDRDQPVRRLARAAARDRLGIRAARRDRVRLVRVPAGRRSAAHALARDRRGRGRELRRRAAAARAGGDRAPGGAVRRDDHAAPGVGGARAELPDDGVARAAHAADRDPRPRRGAERGPRRRPGALARDHHGRGGAARAPRRRHPRPGAPGRAPLHAPARGGRDGAPGRARLPDLRRAGPGPLDRLHA